MVLGGAFILTTRIVHQYTTLLLEATEITLFAAFWIAQTVENWDENVLEPGREEDRPSARPLPMS
jgi:hypothetical protein